MTGMPAPVMEPQPPDCPWDRDIPVYGGRLFYNPDTGLAGCAHCGWSGAPTITDGRTIFSSMHGPRLVVPESARAGGIISTRCPSCESPLLDEVIAASLRMEAQLPARVPRNAPCPCGSGAKAKKCGCREFTT